MKGGDVHGFVNMEQSDAIQVLVSTPARHHDFFRAMAALPANYDPAELEAVFRKFNQKIVGTRPEGLSRKRNGRLQPPGR